MNRVYTISATLCTVVSAFNAQKDTVVGLPKHYFNSVIVADFYRKPPVPLDPATDVGRSLGTFGVGQANLSFYTPLGTRTSLGPDSSVRNNHLLLTGNFYTMRPQFSGLDHNHRLVKNGIGVRYVYNNGKKSVWFFDVSPFFTRDRTARTPPFLRMSSTIVYSHNQSAAFGWRLGITKSFVWGNRYYLPFLGLRVGRLDRVNISLQFPRSVQLVVPVGDRLVLSAYSRAQGGVFYFSNHDSVYFRYDEKAFHFTRYEVATGLRGDVRAGEKLAIYVSAGLSTRNRLTFYGDPANRRRGPGNYYRFFYDEAVPPTLFINLGLVFRFGKTRSYFNERNIYDAVDLNNAMNPNGNVQIPLKPRKVRSDYNLETIEDLLEYTEL